MRFGIYDAPAKSMWPDRVELLRDLKVDEVVMLVEPLWRGRWAPHLTAPQLVGRTHRLHEELGIQVVWAFVPRRTTHYFRAVQRYLEHARYNAITRGGPSYPDALEWVNPGPMRFIPPRSTFLKNTEDWIKAMRRWLWADDGADKVVYECNLHAEFWGGAPDGMRQVHRAWSGTHTMLPAYATQLKRKDDLRPGDVMCLSAEAQDGVGVLRGKNLDKREAEVEVAMSAALEGAQHAGAQHVRWWRLQHLVDSGGELTRAGRWVRGTCRRRGAA